MEMPFLHPGSASPKADKLVERLRAVAVGLLVISAGLLPILFIPSIYMPFSAGKTIIIVFTTVLAIVFCVLAMLRDGSLTLRLPLALLGIWSVVLVAFVSAAFSNDARDAIFGDALDSYTAGFLLLIALVMTATTALVVNKSSIIKLYGVLIFSSILVTLFHVIRLVFGPEALAFGIFNGATASPIGSWNGLAIFYGLVILISLVALSQLPLSRAGRYISIGVVVLSLLMLAIINFSTSWWVLAFVSGVVVLNQLARNLWNKSQNSHRENESTETFFLAVAILIMSITFLLAGARLGESISNKLGVGFIEVRPSVSATLEITRSVYQENLLLGSGPNRFVDMWRQHKDPEINQTIFWNMPFDSGYSYLTTSFINNGLLGVVAWLVFLAGFIWAAIRFLFKSEENDRFWYFISLSSLLASAYFWLMAAVYVPPPSILLLAAFTTGVFLASTSRSHSSPKIVLSAEKGRTYGLALIAIAVMTVSATTYIAYAGVTQLFSVHEFNKVMATVEEGDTVDAIDDRIVGVFETTENDAFARQVAFDQWTQLRSILSIAEPTDADREAFQRAGARAIEAGQLSVDLDPTDPLNHQILGQILSVLAIVGIEGAADRATEAFSSARMYDPQNPLLLLLEADLALQREDTATARTLAEEAVGLKGNYTEALFFLAQLDINEGNIDRAIAIVNGVAQLEPQNPARRYQLGILLAGANRLDEAVTAFEQAVTLDNQYANARYFLALGYAEQGRVEAALEQLRIVRDLNESNTVVDSLITELETTGGLSGSLTEGSPVTDREPSPGNVTEEDLDNGIVTSSNPLPSNTSDEGTVEEGSSLE